MTIEKPPIKKLIEQFLLSYHDIDGEYVTDIAMSHSLGLDEPARQVLEYVHSLPPAYDFEPYIVRKSRKNPYEHLSVDDISREDFTIECSSHDMQARVYRPEHGLQSPSPALVYFHGGGFVLGDIESYDKMLGQLCSQSKITIISIAYRLAPETVFPGAVEDTESAMVWVFNNAKTLKIDPARVAIGGDSAGANLAAGYCLLNQGSNKHTPCFQLLIYPSIIGNDLSDSRTEFSENLLLSKNLLEWFHNHYISKGAENDPRFNLMKFERFDQLPPAFVITGGYDPLRDEGQMYVNCLRKDGVTVNHSCYTDMFHGFINFGALKQSQQAVSECAKVLSGVMCQQHNNSHKTHPNSEQKQEKS